MNFLTRFLLSVGCLLLLVGCRDTRPRMITFGERDIARFGGFCADAPLLEKLQFPHPRLHSPLGFRPLGRGWCLWCRLGAARHLRCHRGGQCGQRTHRQHRQYLGMVARDAETMGWVRERDLLPHVVPDQFITRFIHAFSLGRTWVVLSFVGLALLFLVVQNLRRGRLQMVHYNDIKSFYPTLLCLVVSSSAVLYGALQQFAPDMWQEFYFHPTLNPFAPIAWPLRIFLLSLWGNGGGGDCRDRRPCANCPVSSMMWPIWSFWQECAWCFTSSSRSACTSTSVTPCCWPIGRLPCGGISVSRRLPIDVRAAVKPYTPRADARLAAPSMIERSLREKHSLNEFFLCPNARKTSLL